jgi:hypothetical protein
MLGTVVLVLAVGALVVWREVSRCRATARLLDVLRCDCDSPASSMSPLRLPRLFRHPVTDSDRADVRAMLDAGADPDARSADYLADLSWQARILRILRNMLHRRKTPSVAWSSALRYAICRDPAMLEALLSHGANPNLLVDDLGDHALSQAAYTGQTRVRSEVDPDLNLLLRYGANAHTKDGADALAISVATVDEPAVELLVQHGADCGSGRFNGISTIHYALMYGSGQTLDLLLSHGAAINWNEPSLMSDSVPADRSQPTVTYHTLGDFVSRNAANPGLTDVVRVLRAHRMMPPR